MKKLWGVVLLLSLFLVFAAPAGAQQITTGTIQGSVTDPSNAFVPEAAVEAKNLDTNLTRKLSTDADGRFVFLLLPPGRYTVTVSKQGFANLVQENVNLTVGQIINLSLSLRLAGAEATITVSETPTVETVRVEQSSTLNEITVGTTPILGRKFEDLLTLTPGVSITQGPDGDEINFVGQRGIFTNISLDGGDYINGFFGEQVGGQRAAVDITVEAIKEFQVTVTGGSAEYGRTASGVVNVITKSGTNEFHGSLFHYQRLEALTADDSAGRSLTDFHREQSGGTLGGPVVKDKAFWFVAFEQINGNLQRANLSQQVGSTPCPVSTATAWTPIVTSMAGLNDPANQSLLSSNGDCQRLSLIAFIDATRGQAEGNPVRRPLHNTAIFGRFDWTLTPRNQMNLSYNFNRGVKLNETFDVDTYGNSANGIEGPSKIHVVNFNLVSTLTPRVLSEAHFTFNREKRPRQTTQSNVPADTGVGFFPSFRFGNPFFLQPTIDELFWRTQVRENISWVAGRHTIKFGGEWIHSLNDQVFRGFFTGRYLFSSTEGFLRYASPAAAGGFGPDTIECSDGTTTSWVTAPTACPMGSASTGGPLLFYLQDGIPTGLLPDIPPGASKIDNEEYAVFIQDKWQIQSNFTLSLGLRWEAQIFPNPVIPPAQTAYGPNLSDPNFPSDGTLPSQKRMFQPRVGISWDPGKNGKSVFRASWGIFNARQNMLTQVGSITTNGAQQFTVFCNTFTVTIGLPCFGSSPTMPVWPNILPPPPFTGIQPFSGVRVFSRDYRNPRIYVTNIAYEFEIARDTSIYADFTHSKGVYLTRFVNANRGGAFANLGEVATTSSFGKSLYRGFTVGVRKRFSNHFQLEGNYVFAVDRDDDSNERDPFTDRVCDFSDPGRDYSYSDRDIRHKFNFFAFFELPWKFEANTRMQARSAQPFPGNLGPIPNPSGTGCENRNQQRKDNEFFSFDWRLQRPIKIGERFEIIPVFEMFNTFNNDNNVIQDLNSGVATTPGLFNFDGFLRQGAGDPRQVQFAIKFRW
jgi:hypothetical protein